MEQDLVRATYDAVYAALPKSPTLRRLWHQHVEGLNFPEEFGHVSFVTLSQLQRIAGFLDQVVGGEGVAQQVCVEPGHASGPTGQFQIQDRGGPGGIRTHDSRIKSPEL
jgi:hypothetical protein